MDTLHPLFAIFMKTFLALPTVAPLCAILILSIHANVHARGFGGGEHLGGGERLGEGELRRPSEGEELREKEDFSGADREERTSDVDFNYDGSGKTDISATGPDGRTSDVDVSRNTDGQTQINATGPDGKSASAEINHDGDGITTVEGTGPDGKSYDAVHVGPEGYRSGYVWRDGTYVQVNVEPFVPYAIPFGTFAGWSIVTQPAFVQYPVYATYPVETAVEVTLMQLGFYEGAIDGLLSSVSDAISTYQQDKGLEVTGTITPGLLESLGIQCTEP